MKPKFLYLIFISTAIFLTGGIVASTNGDLPPISISKLPEPTPAATEKSEIEEVKITGETIATIKDGNFDNPTFSPDGKSIAYSSDKESHSEIYLFDLQKQSKSILLTTKQSQKYVPDGSQVFTIEWLTANILRTYLSDGDVGGATLTFNPRTRRLIKAVTESYDGESEIPFPSENLGIYNLFLKTFPEIPKDAAKHAFSSYPFYKIGRRGVVLQFHFAEMDSNIWYFDFQTKKKHLLAEAPKDAKSEFELVGATVVDDKILILTEHQNATTFSIFQSGKVSELLKTDYKGGFQSLFSNTQKSIFMLTRTEFDLSVKNSLWIFDGKTVKRASDLDEIKNVDIDATGSKIAFSYELPDQTRQITVKKINNTF